MMKIYLDMDGVLADFFTGFANHAKVHHWKQIQNKEKTIQELQGTDFFNTNWIPIQQQWSWSTLYRHLLVMMIGAYDLLQD